MVVLLLLYSGKMNDLSDPKQDFKRADAFESRTPSSSNEANHSTIRKTITTTRGQSMSKRTTPAEVKSLISKLKADGFYKLYDVNKETLLYHLPSNTTQPMKLLRDQFYKHCRGYDWADYDNYITACLDNIGGFTFNPSQPPLCNYGMVSKLNTYKQYTATTTESECPLFVEMIDRMLPNASECHLFTQWLAHMIQYPSERPSWAVMLTSDEGTGKGVLFHKIINPLVMKQAVQCSNYNQFLGSHSTALSNSLFVMLDDTKSHSDSLITELKSKISEPEILLNPKYLQPYKQQVFARILLASNERRPIKLGSNDTRRWFAPAYITHKISREETSKFYAGLIEWLDTTPNALDSVYNYLNTYSLEGFNAGYVTPTETLTTMVSLSTTTKQLEVEEWCNAHKVYKLEQLTNYFNDCPDLAKKYALDHYSQVKKLDLDNTGKRSNWWIPVNFNNKQAREFYNSNSLQSIPI